MNVVALAVGPLPESDALARPAMAGDLDVVVTSPMGPRVDPVTGVSHLHNGTDYAVPVGTPVVAAMPGVVTAVLLDDDISGSAVIIDHSTAGYPYRTSYVHLSAVAHRDHWIDGGMSGAAAAAMLPDLIGTQLQRGDLVGLSGGAPGTWGSGRSTGPHLHLVMKDATGQPVESVRLIDWSATPGIHLWERTTSGARVRLR